MKISIITPCRNSEKTIERTIRSVVSQSDKKNEIEYIIIDGESTDNTLNIIERYAKQYSFVKYISEKDRSMTEALNKGMRLATGDIVGSINADDVYLPDLFSKVCDYFKKNEKDIVMINTYIVREGGYVKSHNTPKMFSPFLCTLIECPFPECGIFFKRECVQNVGLFDEKIKYTQDLDLYLKQYYKGYRFGYLNVDGSCFFVSDHNYSSVVSNKMRNEVCTYIKNPLIYKYISGSWFSKVIKVILGMRHYYVFKKFTYQDILKEMGK